MQSRPDFTNFISNEQEAKQDVVEAFHLHALNDPGVVISICTDHPSGCHDFGLNLKNQFPQVDYVYINIDVRFQGSSIPIEICPQSIKDPENWQCFIMTGCALEAVASLVNHLKESYKIKQLTHVYIVAPPHLADDFDKDYVSESTTFNNDFSSCTDAKIDLLTAGVNCKPKHNIGLPMTIPLIPSNYAVSANCYGMMYNSHPNFLNIVNGIDYLNAWFSEIRQLAGLRNGDKTLLKVIAIGMSNQNKIVVSATASHHFIKVVYTERLSQADFMGVMSALASKGGIVSLDGAQSLMQALCLGVRVMFYSTDTNKKYCEQLIDLLPENRRIYASVILGQSQDYQLLENLDECRETCIELQNIFQMAMAKFQKNKDIAASQKSNKKQKTIHFMTSFLEVNFEDAIKDELKRVTHLDWVYAKQKKKAFVNLSDEVLRIQVLDHLKEAGVAVFDRKIKKSEIRILVIDCLEVKVSELRKIQPMINSKELAFEAG